MLGGDRFASRRDFVAVAEGSVENEGESVGLKQLV